MGFVMLGGALIGFVLGSIFRQGFLGGILGAWLGYASKRYGFQQWQRVLRVVAWSLFGYIAGSVLGLGVLGLLLGFYVGNSMRSSSHASSFTFDGFGGTRRATAHESFIEITFHTIGYLAKASGSVKDRDITFAKRYMEEFGYSAREKEMAMAAFRQGRLQTKAPLALLQQHQLWLLTALAAKQTMIHVMHQYEQAVGRLNSRQQKAIDQFYYFLGVERQRFYHSYQSAHGHEARHQQFSGHDAYKVLGLDQSASVDEIKRAYRKLMARYHPDRVMSKGLSEAEMQRYTEKAKRVQQAYAALKEQKGF